VGVFPEEPVDQAIAALILAIAVECGVPPQFALAVALEENNILNPLAVHMNTDGTRDLGVMQLNSGWYTGNWQNPETNILAGCQLMRELRDRGLNWWQVAIAYNCGYQRLQEGPPNSSIEYANRVVARWGYKF
jgi:soluble lytic murein transglycosylase-like protein